MAKSKRHINIPIFIPHLGCPNDCVFCNQRSISGKLNFDKGSVSGEIEAALATIPEGCDIEIAFFGGSFTGIDRDLMVYLLDTAEEYVRAGLVDAIRMSTRPDYISDEILDILSGYSVRTVELGIQSMDDEVLKISKRGHNSAASVNACKMIKAAGYDLVGQMMIGLPGSTPDSERYTADEICKLGANAARVYPTVVFYRTELCHMTDMGLYEPLSEHDAVMRTFNVLKVFDRYRVPCIRVGLCASENLSDPNEVRGGASQSAIGEMAMGMLFREKIISDLEKLPADTLRGKSITVEVPSGCSSKAAGHRKSNKIFISEKFGIKNIGIYESCFLRDYDVVVKIKNEGNS